VKSIADARGLGSDSRRSVAVAVERLEYQRAASRIGAESGGEGPLYEVIAAQFGAPGSGRNPMNFPTVGSFNISAP
jgi:hypothetical protein